MAELINLHNEFHLGNQFLLNVATEMSNILSDRYRVIIKYDAQELPHYNDGLLNIELATSAEMHRVPHSFFRNDVHAIFQNYFMLDKFDRPIYNPLSYPLPIGTFVDFGDMSNIDIKPLPDRKYDFSFVGQIPHTGTRDCFKRNLDKLIKESGNKFKYYVDYTSGFNDGLPHSQYIDLLNESKIVLCPHGASSAETFRFFESIKMGAFPMVEWVPAFWYYENAPFVKGLWHQIDYTLCMFLNRINKAMLHSLVNYNITVLTEKNLAQHLVNVLKSRDSQDQNQISEQIKLIRESLINHV